MNYAKLREFLDALDVRVSHRWKQWLMCSCPLAEWEHPKGSDSKPSFGVSVRDGISGFHCFTCHSKGKLSSLIRILEHKRGVSYGPLAIQADMADAVSDIRPFDASPETWEGHARKGPPKPIEEAIFAGMFTPAYEFPASEAYLAKRGIGRATAERLGIMFDIDDSRVLFPVRDRKGRLFGYSGRTILRPDQYPADRMYGKVKDYAGLPKEWMLLGAEGLTGERPVLLVEGLFAYARMHEIGAAATWDVVASLGSKLSTHQADTLEENGKGVYALYDNDEAGDKGIFGYDLPNGRVEGLADILAGKVPCMLPDPWPEGVDDPDDLTLDQLRGMIAMAQLIS